MRPFIAAVLDYLAQVDYVIGCEFPSTPKELANGESLEKQAEELLLRIDAK